MVYDGYGWMESNIWYLSINSQPKVTASCFWELSAGYQRHRCVTFGPRNPENIKSMYVWYRSTCIFIHSCGIRVEYRIISVCSISDTLGWHRSTPAVRVVTSLGSYLATDISNSNKYTQDGCSACPSRVRAYNQPYCCSWYWMMTVVVDL